MSHKASSRFGPSIICGNPVLPYSARYTPRLWSNPSAGKQPFALPVNSLPKLASMGVHTQFESDDEGQISSPVPSKNVAKRSMSKPDSRPMSASDPPKYPERARRRPSKRGSMSQKPAGAQIRALERLLENKAHTLPVAARKQKEQELAELRRLAGEKTRRKVESSIAKKYHMVRFFERRKLERTLLALEQKQEVNPKVQAKKMQVMKDLNYVRNFPRGRKYVALFPKGGHTEESRAEVEAIHAEVERFLKGSSIDNAPASNDAPKSGVTNGDTDFGDEDDSAEQTDDFFLEDTVE